ncbi:hypothetical protein [Halobacteriovorax sp. JY17]|uniref:hypothetical protein n=1 Tax=Halobacteriovorax sp. JY17 TaxID=2014617 RepID=UPI000C3F6AF5|nr:hypothetical protein [Halobacteriovorax sp. JY17]PIK13711.1 MAG: hypothetical protein CES88_16100 [Halobacteriovorax sp. JY17]
MKILIIILSLITYAGASEDHEHGKKNIEEREVPHIEHGNHDEHGHKKDSEKGEHTHEEGDDHHEEKHDDHEEHGDSDKHGHDHGGGKAIGEGKAITEVDEERGFKLSQEAITSLGIKLKTITKFNHLLIAKKSLVTSKSEKGIYRFREGFFKFISVKIIKEQGDGYLIQVDSLKAKDQIVVSGIGLLRVSDVYSTDKSEYGHAH